MKIAKPPDAMIRLSPLLVLLILTNYSAPVAAQMESALGQRVRLTYAPGPGARSATVIGRLVRAASDTMVVDGASRNVSVPAQNVERLEVSRGMKSQTGPGALIGMLGGGIIMAGVARASYEECTDSCLFSTTKAQDMMIGAVLGGLGGAALGALVGAVTKVDSWEEVPLRPTVGISATSPGLTVSLRF